MKIGYFGTPAHSAELLEFLIQNKIEVSFIVTNQDKPQGRKNILTPSPLKQIGLKYNIPVLQFANLKDEINIDQILSYHADLFIVFAYGSILPRRLFETPHLGTVNLHGSLLPELRGASPVQTSILQDKKETGITIQYIVEKLDAGNIISQVKIPITDEDTTGSLLKKITSTGIKEIFRLLQTNPTIRFNSTPQNHEHATFCSKIKSEDRILHFKDSARNIFNKIRALHPDPVSFCMFRDKKINILSTKLLDDKIENPEYGKIRMLDKKTFAIECGDGGLIVPTILKPENRNEMKLIDFINGFKPLNGEFFK